MKFGTPLRAAWISARCKLRGWENEMCWHKTEEMCLCTYTTNYIDRDPHTCTLTFGHISHKTKWRQHAEDKFSKLLLHVMACVWRIPGACILSNTAAVQSSPIRSVCGCVSGFFFFWFTARLNVSLSMQALHIVALNATYQQIISTHQTKQYMYRI